MCLYSRKTPGGSLLLCWRLLMKLPWCSMKSVEWRAQQWMLSMGKELSTHTHQALASPPSLSLPRVLFWTDGANIRMQTLSGIPLGVCHRPLLEATSLAVDVQRTRLYWLSSSDRPGVPLTVSQMEYDSTSCHINRSVWRMVLNLASSN